MLNRYKKKGLSKCTLLNRALIFVVLGILVAPSSYGYCPKGNTKSPKLLVEYIRDVNFANGAQYIEGHNAFVEAEFQSGRIQSSGLWDNDYGSVFIYTTVANEHISTTLSRDPLIAAKVFKAKVRAWQQCAAPQAGR